MIPCSVYRSFSLEIKGREDKPSASPVWIGEVQRSDAEKEIVVAGAYGFRNNASPFLQKLVKHKKWNTSYAEIQASIALVIFLFLSLEV